MDLNLHRDLFAKWISFSRSFGFGVKDAADFLLSYSQSLMSDPHAGRWVWPVSSLDVSSSVLRCQSSYSHHGEHTLSSKHNGGSPGKHVYRLKKKTNTASSSLFLNWTTIFSFIKCFNDLICTMEDSVRRSSLLVSSGCLAGDCMNARHWWSLLCRLAPDAASPEQHVCKHVTCDPCLGHPSPSQSQAAAEVNMNAVHTVKLGFNQG